MIMRKQIKDLFENPQRTMKEGLWFSGYLGEGEYKEWYDNGLLYKHCFYKDGEEEGEFKQWYENGLLLKHCFYKDGAEDGEFKMWYDDGKLGRHHLYKNGRVIKDLL